MTDAATGGRTVDAEERWHLEDRRQFLARSLEDAEAEHEAGDLADEDYLLLRRRDEALLAEVEAALASLDRAAVEAAPSQATAARAMPRADDEAAGGEAAVGEAAVGEAAVGDPPRGHRRIWLAVVGTALLVAGAVILVVHLTSPRLPGETVTGGTKAPVTQQIQQQLDQASTLVQKNQLVEALELYKQVLSETAREPQALAEWGWLEWEAATTRKDLTLAAQGRAAVAESVKVDPALYAGYLYLGTILLNQGQPGQAVTQYKKFLAQKPPKQWIDNGAPFIQKAFAQTHQPLPAGVPTS